MTQPRANPFPPSMEQLVRLSMDRFAALSDPTRRDDSPLADGGTPAEWAAAAGVGAATVHETIRHLHPHVIDTGPYDPATIAHTALQRLSRTAHVERFGGLPLRYRPL